MTSLLIRSLLTVVALVPALAHAAIPTQSPGSYAITQVGPQSATASWTAVPQATSYLTTVSTPNQPTRIVRTAVTSVTVRGLSANLPYAFKTSGRNASGEGPLATTSFTPSPIALTAPPTNLDVINMGTSASIRWTGVPNAVSYAAQLQDVTSGAPAVTKTTTLTMTAFTGLTVNHQYSITINALDGAGNSTTATANFVAAALTAPTAAATGITIVPQSGTTALATWSAVPTATAYQLYLGTSPSTLNTQRPIFTTSTSRLLTGLSSGTTYYFAIRPLNAAGSAAIGLPMSFLSMTPPAAPSLSVTPGILAATATWNTVSGASQYTLYWMSGSFVKASATVLANATSPTAFNGLDSDLSYGFGVSATNPAGEGTLSSVQTLTPSPLLAPTEFHTAGGPTSIQTTWTPASGATSYEMGYNTGATFNSGTATIVSAASSPATLSSLTNEQQYSLAVRSVLGSARSAWTTAVQETPHAASTVLWRDARDLVGVTAQGCGYNAWSTWVYDPCNNPYGAATQITGNAAVGALPATTSPYRLTAGTYHVWSLASAQSLRTFRLAQDATVLSAAIPTTSTAWLNMGTLTIDPTQPLTIDMPANGNLTNLGVYVRGFYFTQGTETPTYQPAGNTGDQIQNFATPTGLALTPAPGGVIASWNATPNASSYTLYYLTGNGTFSKEAATAITGLTGTSTTLSGLGSNTAVQVAMASNFPNGESVLSAVVSSTTTALVSPTNVAASLADSASTITWTAASGVTSYNVAYQTGSTFNANTATIQPITGTSLTLSGLTNGQPYVVAVQSVYGAGTSSWSTPAVSFTPTIIYSQFYRDARNLSGVGTTSCSGQWWLNPSFLYVNTIFDCGVGLNATNSSQLYGNGSSSALGALATTNPISTSFPQVSGSYHVWVYVNSHNVTQMNFTINSTTISTNLPTTSSWVNNAGFSWVKIGTTTMSAQTASFTLTKGTNPSGNDILFRGIYLTTGTDTPTCVPVGSTGDQANQTCPQ